MKEFTRENEVFETIAVLLIALETGQPYRLSNPYHRVVENRTKLDVGEVCSVLANRTKARVMTSMTSYSGHVARIAYLVSRNLIPIFFDKS